MPLQTRVPEDIEHRLSTLGARLAADCPDVECAYVFGSANHLGTDAIDIVLLNSAPMVKGANCMGHAIHRVEHFDIVAPYTLRLRFADHTEQQINFRPVLEGEVFGPLQDLSVFNAVELDTAFGTLQWPNGADFDPETLHDWPQYCEELAAMAQRWAQTSDPRANNAMEPTARS